ncbi:MAG: type II secretion system protein [Chloroflexi bacterium]|nr:type II secretion system protein [Chloroflexota bacterium]
MNQKGFTLLTLVVGLGILGLLSSSAGAVVSQSVRSSYKGNDTLGAFNTIENAGFWISRDGRMADTTDLINGGGPVSSVTLQWIDQFDLGSVQHSSTFELVGNEVRRTYDGVTRTLARNVSSLSFSLSNSLITVIIESSPPGFAGVREQRSYLIYLRPTG